MSFFDEIKRTINRGMEQANQTSQRMIEISRLSFKLKGKKDELNKLQYQLGIATYRVWAAEKQWKQTEEIKQLLQTMENIDTEIGQIESEIAKLKSQSDQQYHQSNPSPYQAQPMNPPLPNQPQLPYQSQQPPQQPYPSQQPIPEVSPNVQPMAQPKRPVVNLLYLCPFCASQVAEQDASCGNCNQRFY